MNETDLKYIVIGILLISLSIGLVYGFVAYKYEVEIAEKDSIISNRSIELIDLYTAPEVVTTPPPPTDLPEEAETDLEFCQKCHNKVDTASFHFPERIMSLEESTGRQIRICTTCHGEPVMPVHFSAIQRKVVKCETCHIRGGGGFTVPQKREDDLLICQLCHAGGDYIAIHIDGDILKGAEIDAKWIKRRAGNECTICHNEELYRGKDIVELHKERAAFSGGRVVAETPEKTIDANGDIVLKNIKVERDVASEFAEPSQATTVIVID